MKVVVFAIAALAAASSAVAAERVTDVDYLRANRCKGLATGLQGVADPKAIDTFIRSAGGARTSFVIERAGEEFDRARREARKAENKDRLTAELTGPCSAYLAGPNGAAGA